jgi:hypothetical protein
MPRARRGRATAVRARAQRVGKYKPPVWLYGLLCIIFSRSPTCRGRWCTYKRGPHSCGHPADPHWFLWVQVNIFPAFGKNFFCQSLINIHTGTNSRHRTILPLVRSLKQGVFAPRPSNNSWDVMAAQGPTNGAGKSGRWCLLSCFSGRC